MSRKLDHEKVTAAKRIQSQGAIWSNQAGLTEKERDALAIGRKRAKAAASRRQEANKKSLIENLHPTGPQQAMRQLSSIKEIYLGLSEREKSTRGKWMLKKIRELESSLPDNKPRLTQRSKRVPKSHG